MGGGRPLSSFDELLSSSRKVQLQKSEDKRNGSSDRILVDAADGRLVAGIVEWLFGEVLLDVTLIPADQRSSSIRPVIWRSVAELMAGMLC